MTPFSHLDTGTSEEVWRAEARISAAPLLDLDIDELVVVAAHPDDETLGAAGLIRRVHGSGAGVTVVVVTDGEASHPRSPSHSRDDLRSIRRIEVLQAVDALAPRARVHFLGLPDGALGEDAHSLDAALSAVIEGIPASGSRMLVAAPWSGDGHRDHRVTAESVARLTRARGIRHVGYPIWLWHWGHPDDVPWELGVAVALTPGERSLKARALRLHVSQTEPLSDAPGDEAIVSESMQAHFDRDTEFYLREAAPDGPAVDAGAAGRTLPPRSSTTSMRGMPLIRGDSRLAGTRSASGRSCSRASFRPHWAGCSRSGARPDSSRASSPNEPSPCSPWTPPPPRWRRRAHGSRTTLA